jgi:hypothetical protein
MSTDAPGQDEGKKGQEGLDWFWVITSPVTAFRDQMLVLELDGVHEFVPVFSRRAEAEAVLKRLGASGRAVQAMHQEDIRRFAKEKGLGVRTVSGEGRIGEAWGAAGAAEGEGAGHSGPSGPGGAG